MNIRKMIADNMPVLLTSAAVAGVASTAILAVKATPNALRDIWDAQSEHNREITKAEMVQLTWRHYVPAAVVGGATITALIGAHSISVKRQAALVGLYSITEKAYSEYREKAVEKIGEKADRAIRDQIVQEKMDAAPPPPSSIVFADDDGDYLFFDTMTARYFKSNHEKVNRAVNDINRQCINDMYASQNDFYRLLGLEVTVFGEEVGWRTDEPLDVHFVSKLREDGRPAVAIDYRTEPIRGYWRGHA